MHSLDNAFFEEYKRLNKLCSDMYSCQNGLSEYIADMEDKSRQGQFQVSSWDADYKTLKHVRWIRNQIAHDPDAYLVSTSSDLAFLQEFYSRILLGQDPIALLRKATHASHFSQPKQEQKQTGYSQSTVSSHPPVQPYRRPLGCILVLIGIGLFILILLFFHSYS